MRRSQKLFRHARCEAIAAAAYGSVASAAGVWAAVAAGCYASVPGGALAAAVAIVAFRLCRIHLTERRRLMDLARQECAVWERCVIAEPMPSIEDLEARALWLALGAVTILPALAAILFLIY